MSDLFFNAEVKDADGVEHVVIGVTKEDLDAGVKAVKLIKREKPVDINVPETESK